MKKWCWSCKAEKEFNKNKSNPDGLASECRDCRKIYMTAYYAQNRDKMNGDNKARGKARLKEARQKVLLHYSQGEMKCACKGCNEHREEFLSINHINGGGKKDRDTFKGARTFYEYLVKNNYPCGLNVLCHNCNLSHGIYGYCPHEKESMLVKEALV